MTEHDSSYKLLFSHPEMVADLMRGFVREEWVAQLDFSTLERVSASAVSDDLREREDDIVWRLRWGERWLYLYLLLEFQSSVDRFMAVRLLTYVGLLYQDLIKAQAIAPGAKLPPVLPIVLYNGEKRWWARQSLAELSEPDLPAALARYQPRLRYLLLEERAYDEQELAGLRNVAAALFRLENSRRAEDIERVLAALVEWLGDPAQTALRRSFVVWLKRVLLPARVPGVDIPDVIELQEIRTMLAERVKKWTEEWKQEGLQAGLQKGRQVGLQEGRQEGRREGMLIGEARLLRRQLVRRFGDLPEWVGERLSQATEIELERWSERLLESDSLEAVFEDTR